MRQHRRELRPQRLHHIRPHRHYHIMPHEISNRAVILRRALTSPKSPRPAAPAPETCSRTGDGTRELRANAGPFAVDGVAALGVGAAPPRAAPATTVEETAEGVVLANSAIRVEIDGRG